MKCLMKMYLKSMNKDQRAIRMMFVGKRLKVKQNLYLHFNNHPFEDNH